MSLISAEKHRSQTALIPSKFFSITFAQYCINRGVARIFPWGGHKYRFQNFGKCNLGEYSLRPGDESPWWGVGTFPNHLNGYVPPNRVVILERFRLLRNTVHLVASQPVFYCGTSG